MKRIARWRIAAGIGLPVAVSALALTISCATDSEPHLTSPMRSVSQRAVVRALTADQQARLEAARARTKWVGDAHHAGMQVIIRRVADLRRAKRPLPKKGTVEYCRLLQQAGEAALAVLDSSRGIGRGESERMERIRRDPDLVLCTHGMALFGLTSPPVLSASSVRQGDEPEVTGAYETYLDPMQAAVENSDASVAGVRAGVSAILAEAVSAGIPQGDLLALSSFAGLIESSAAEWNSWGGGGGGCVDGCWAMSVFPHRGGGWIGAIIAGDAIGCLSTVKGWGAMKLLLFGVAWEALAGECGVRAALASGGIFLTKLFK